MTARKHAPRESENESATNSIGAVWFWAYSENPLTPAPPTAELKGYVRSLIEECATLVRNRNRAIEATEENAALRADLASYAREFERLRNLANDRTPAPWDEAPTPQAPCSCASELVTGAPAPDRFPEDSEE